MTRVTASVTTRRARLPADVGSARARLTERAGLLLTLRDSAGHVGRGEASPLPGFSPDDLARTVKALDSLAGTELALEPSSDVAAELTRFGSVILDDCPAARHAVQTALLDLIGARLGQPAWRLLASGDGAARQLGLAALLRVESERDLLESAERAIGAGASAVKVKLGFAAPSVEMERLRRLRAQLGPNIPIRLDANAGWSPDEARERLSELMAIEPEFVEQPVATRDLDALDRSAVPLALDESLIELGPAALDRVVDRISVRVLVLKPMAIGGLVRCLELSRWADQRGIDVVVSHLFDGPVALAAAAALALAIGSPNRAMGLFPHAGLQAWPPTPLPMFGSGAIHALESPGLGLMLADHWEETCS